jgi:hypothetical protein
LICRNLLFRSQQCISQLLLRRYYEKDRKGNEKIEQTSSD